MNFEAFGNETDEDLLLALGWGNRTDHENVRWLVDRFVDAGYRVHAATLPTNCRDFEAAYRAPLADRAAALDDPALVGHSAGALALAHVEAPRPRVYLSPWWGMHERHSRVVLDAVCRLPTAVPLVPVEFDRAQVGDLATPAQRRDAPGAVSPAFLREIRDAQRSLPPFREGGAVFCSLTDRIVSVSAIGRRAPSDAVTLYDGGHEFFSDTAREAVVDRVLDAVAAT